MGGKGAERNVWEEKRDPVGLLPASVPPFLPMKAVLNAIARG